MKDLLTEDIKELIISHDISITLSLPKQSINSLPMGLELLLPTLRKVMLQNNNISDIKPFVNLPNLYHLDLSHNIIDTLLPISDLNTAAQLTVLNMSYNKLTSLCGLTKQSSKHIQALIVSYNSLIDVSALANIGTKLNTLILSGNKDLAEHIELTINKSRNKNSAPSKPGSSLLRLISDNFSNSLRKLSLSHVGISNIPRTINFPLLTELRLAHNQISNIPLTVAIPSLKICDISNNRFTTLLSLKPSKYIENLSICGNPLVAHIKWTKHIATDIHIKGHVSAYLHKLKILDGTKFIPLSRKEGEHIRSLVKTDRHETGNEITNIQPICEHVDDISDKVEYQLPDNVLDIADIQEYSVLSINNAETTEDNNDNQDIKKNTHDSLTSKVLNQSIMSIDQW